MSERSNAARAARNAYAREWRKKNPDKVKDAERRYWEKKGREMTTAPLASIPENGLPSREALREFLKEHDYRTSPTAFQLKADGNTMMFLYYDQEAYGDRTYFYCVEDGKVYSNYFSIGD